jgi:tyrosine-specific transport protein
MNKTFGSTCMIAGTAIGAGMIALPMTLAKLGLIETLVLMLITWLVVYYSALL